MKNVTLVYIHGLNGHNSDKAKQLKEHFKDYDVINPQLELEPNTTIKQLEEILSSIYRDNKNSSVYIVGSSLGGFYALYFANTYGYPVFLINPSLHPEISLFNKIPSEYIEQLKLLQNKIDTSKYTNRFINAFLANDDELLNHSKFITTFKNIHTLKSFDNVGHRFTRFDELVIPLIENIIIADSKIDFSQFEDIL